MAEEREATGRPERPLETPTDTTGVTADIDADREAAREGNADAAIQSGSERVTVAEALSQKEAAIEAAVDIARERDLAAAAASRMAAERDQAASLAAVETTVASQNAFGFWLMVAIVVAILVVGMAWAAMSRPWEARERNLDQVTPAPATAATSGSTGSAPSPGGPMGR